MKINHSPVSNKEAQVEDKLLTTAKFQCHGAYVIGFNIVLAAVIYGTLVFFK